MQILAHSAFHPGLPCSAFSDELPSAAEAPPSAHEQAIDDAPRAICPQCEGLATLIILEEWAHRARGVCSRCGWEWTG